MQLASSSHKCCVPLALYAQFADDLLQALRMFHGADWTPDLMEQWRLAIEGVGRSIFTTCQNPVHD
jgi:hypothetical protein